jgi:monofunctional biosynthetic peptidoglycan transglycosylase
LRRAAVVGLVLLALAALAIWLSLPDVRSLAKKRPETTAFIELRREQAAEAGKRFRLRWRWRPLGRISRYLRHAVIRAEDAKFWKHEGVDWDAVKKAAERNVEKGELSIGGSTITQQLAKNLFLSPSRDPVRKVRELLIARRLERHLSKQRILELYLNVAEWGPGVFGAEAAARHWYGRSASQLTPLQAARLAVALPSPRRRSPRVRAYWLRRKAARLVWAMWRGRLIDDGARDAAFAELGVLRRKERPRSDQAPPRDSVVPDVSPPNGAP